VSVRVLSIHADYACRHSGACCAAGWRIPVDPGLATALARAAIEDVFPRAARLTESRDGLTVLRLAADGACTAFEPASATTPAMCAIHRVLGHDALPSACRHFPRVCLVERRGVSITLSHFCPTAAGRLFENRPIRVIEDPPGFGDSSRYEGLDAREALPPLLAPGMLMGLESYAAWEARALEVLDDDRLSPEAALGLLRARAECLRTWTPRDGPLVEHVSQMTAVPVPGSVPVVGSVPVPGSVPSRGTHLARFNDVLACVPAGLDHPSAPEGLDNLDREFVAPEWPRWSAPLRRYLAARLHASWVPYQGRGLRTVVESLASALAAVRVEAARRCAAAGRALDESLLRDAIQMADLLIVHEADAQALATTWSRVENGRAR
jgi:Fe-S-cluster containining protein